MGTGNVEGAPMMVASQKAPSTTVSDNQGVFSGTATVVDKVGSVSVVDKGGSVSVVDKGSSVSDQGAVQQQQVVVEEVDEWIGDSKSWGPPILAEWDSEERYLVNGLGL